MGIVARTRAAAEYQAHLGQIIPVSALFAYYKEGVGDGMVELHFAVPVRVRVISTEEEFYAPADETPVLVPRWNVELVGAIEDQDEYGAFEIEGIHVSLSGVTSKPPSWP